MSVKSTAVTGHSVKPDPKFQNLLASKFINYLMLDGKKTVAETIFYKAMDEVAKRIKDKDPIKVFEGAVSNVKPMVEVKSRRVGGANYQVPVQVSPKRQTALAIRWMLQSVRDKSGKPTYVFLANEICDAYHREGASMTKRENTHRMAEANKAFAHFAW